MRVVLILLAAGAAVLAGCVGSPQEATACPSRSFVSVHYDARLPAQEVHDAMVALGWTVEGSDGDVTRYAPPGEAAVRAVVAPRPGPSGEGTLVTVEEAGAGDVGGEAETARQARAVAKYLNTTFDGPPLASWIEGTHESCPEEVSVPGLLPVGGARAQGADTDTSTADERITDPPPGTDLAPADDIAGPALGWTLLAILVLALVAAAVVARRRTRAP